MYVVTSGLYVGARNLKSGPQDCTQELYSLGQLFRCLDFLTIFFLPYSIVYGSLRQRQVGFLISFERDSIHALGLKRSPCDNYF